MCSAAARGKKPVFLVSVRPHFGLGHWVTMSFVFDFGDVAARGKKPIFLVSVRPVFFLWP